MCVPNSPPTVAIAGLASLSMEVIRFNDEYELAAGLYDVEAAELRERDSRQGQPLQRWLALEAGTGVGAVVTWLRPDDRMFLMFEVRGPEAYAPLVRAVVDALGRSVHTMVDESDVDDVVGMEHAGFRTEMVSERFRIRFDDALHYLNRAWVPSGYEIRSALEVDEARLFALDNEIRNLVPGTDGWYGDAEWFHSELAESPPFDASAYLVAVDQSSDSYVGLVRVWRNADGPRLGLVGVTPSHRSQPVAGALLKHSLTAASEWGHDSFSTETSPSNSATYPRMSLVHAESHGRFLQLVRPHTPRP